MELSQDRTESEEPSQLEEKFNYLAEKETLTWRIKSIKILVDLEQKFNGIPHILLTFLSIKFQVLYQIR